MSEKKMRLATYSREEKRIEFTHETSVQVPVESIMAFLLDNWYDIPRAKRDVFESKLLAMHLDKSKGKLVDDEEDSGFKW